MTEPGVDGFAALFGARAYLNTTGRLAPFILVGAGLFHASVDPPNRARPTSTLIARCPDFPRRSSTISWPPAVPVWICTSADGSGFVPTHGCSS